MELPRGRDVKRATVRPMFRLMGCAVGGTPPMGLHTVQPMGHVPLMSHPMARLTSNGTAHDTAYRLAMGMAQPLI